jgi:predicted permease
MSPSVVFDIARDLVLNPLISLGAICVGLIGVSLTIWRGGGWARRLGLFALMASPIILAATWPHVAGMGFKSEGRATPDLFGRTEIFYPDVQDLAVPAILTLIITAIIFWKRSADRAYVPWAGALAYGLVAAETFLAALDVGVYW